MSLNNYYTIYRHIAPNGKSYVGVTRQSNLNRRWMSGHGYASCPLFNNAIQKYGWDSFKHEILEDQVPIENINEKEKYWIHFYQSNNRDFGYNIEDGGHSYRSFSEETRKKISEAIKGKSKSELCKQKLRELNLGKHLSDETKKKVAESHYKPVYQLDKNGNIINEFDSIFMAAQYINRDNSSISKCCKGKQKTCGGYMWKYKEEQL